MTPTPEWYEADSDDSDRSVTDDVAANTPQASRGANLPAADVLGGYSDADLLRKRTEALNRTSAENERLRGEKQRLSERAATDVLEATARAEAAEAKLRDVEVTLRPTYRECPDHEFVVPDCDNCWAWSAEAEVIERARAVLARSQAPQAPAEQEGA